MERYEVFLHNIPKVSDDGTKSLPIPPRRDPQEFSELAEARKHAAEHKDEFERVVVIRTVDDKQKMVMRFMDGEEIELPPEEEKEEAAEESAETAEG